jgi:hypothetical protein
MPAIHRAGPTRFQEGYARPLNCGVASEITALLSGLDRRNAVQASVLVYSRSPKLAQSDHAPDDGKKVPPRPHDTGSQANETVDGLDAETEALRRATEDTPAGPGKIDKTPVFDRADLPPKI